MHMFAAFYFVIVLTIEKEWNISYDQLIRLWTLGALLIGLGAIPFGWLSDRWSRSGTMIIMFIGMGITSITSIWFESINCNNCYQHSLLRVNSKSHQRPIRHTGQSSTNSN